MVELSLALCLYPWRLNVVILVFSVERPVRASIREGGCQCPGA